jgi:hypothetical protein
VLRKNRINIRLYTPDADAADIKEKFAFGVSFQASKKRNLLFAECNKKKTCYMFEKRFWR